MVCPFRRAAVKTCCEEDEGYGLEPSAWPRDGTELQLAVPIKVSLVGHRVPE